MWRRLGLSANRSLSTSSIAIDESSLVFPKARSIYSNLQESRLSTEEPLLRYIQKLIKYKGPLTVAEYMSICLSHPQYGYYKSKEEKFGLSGDFVTAPEISPIFSEMIAVFCIFVWQQLQMPSKIRLVEMGPGKGTMMRRILDASNVYPEFRDAIDRNIVLVESSPFLQGVQQNNLAGNAVSWESDFDNVVEMNKVEPLPTVILCQELFDALPIHQFKINPDRGTWNEVLIDVDYNQEDLPLRLILSGVETSASRLLQKQFSKHVLKFDENDILEISLKGGSLVQKMSKLIEDTSGAALIVDYGNRGSLFSVNSPFRKNTLRGISNHTFVNPLIRPGEIDLSVDVNFDWLEYSVGEVGENYVELEYQGNFLRNLGIEDRVSFLLDQARTEQEEIEIFRGYERLTTNDTLDIEYDGKRTQIEGMGDVYKCMGIFSKNMTYLPGF